MSLEAVMNLPASEIMYWHEYFSIYPFTRDLEDLRHAQLIHTLRIINGDKKSKIKHYLPAYKDISLGEKRARSLIDQREEALEFAKAYSLASKKRKH